MTNCDPILILCGGLSRRMGSPKALLLCDNETLIERHCRDIIMDRTVWLGSAGERFTLAYPVQYIDDAFSGREGPLSAILSGLEQANLLGYNGIFVMACDTLVLPSQMILQLEQGQDYEAWRCGIVMLSGSHDEPLRAYWAVAQAPQLRRYLEAGHRRVMTWVQQTITQRIKTPQWWQKISNFNTPSEYNIALQQYKR